jgi:hypothetical protein
MRISGFTFLRDAAFFGYPFEESIRSLLPVVDEYVIAVGECRDDTLDRLRDLQRADPRIRIIETQWNEQMKEKGFVYAQQKMIAQSNCTGDWAFYLEGDEVVHEDDAPVIKAAMARHLENPAVEALAFDYLHFYGTPDQLADSPAWYRREVRVIRNTIRTFAPDGQYFVVMDRIRRGRYPRAAMSGGRIFHYGHCRLRDRRHQMIQKLTKYWDAPPPPSFDYGRIDPQILVPFRGTHPAVMKDWLAHGAERTFEPMQGYRPSAREKKHRLARKIERLLGVDLSKRHFVLVK